MKKLCFVVLILLLLGTALPAWADGPVIQPAGPQNQAGDWLKVCNPDSQDRLNLRKEARTDSISFGKYYTGAPVQLNGPIQNGWAPVQIGPLEGFMQADYLVSDPAQELASAMPIVKIDNRNGEGLNLRSRPSTSSVVLRFCPNGASVVVMGVLEDWCHVFVNGQSGFLWADGLSPRPQFRKSEEARTPDTFYVWNNHPTNRLNLRTAPTKNAPTLGKYYSGTPVTLLPSGHTDTWKHVQVGNVEGYMFAAYLDDGTHVRAAQPIVTISNPSGSGLNLRAEASSYSKKLAFCPNGTQAVVLGVSPSWCHVVTGGQVGFLLREKLTPEIKFDLSAP